MNIYPFSSSLSDSMLHISYNQLQFNSPSHKTTVRLTEIALVIDYYNGEFLSSTFAKIVMAVSQLSPTVPAAQLGSLIESATVQAILALFFSSFFFSFRFLYLGLPID
jgi:hypothetical protein